MSGVLIRCSRCKVADVLVTPLHPRFPDGPFHCPACAGRSTPAPRLEGATARPVGDEGPLDVEGDAEGFTFTLTGKF